MKTSKLLLGAAYYTEYMPYERVEKDIALMKDIGFNVIRIAESTWSTWEPTDGEFDFSKLTHVLDVASANDIKVIIGTPTYAIPSWLAIKHPEIMTLNKDGQSLYGARQSFDITNPDYRFHARRIIRKLMETIKDYDCIIGYQLDNETKSAGSSSYNAQSLFVESLMKKYPNIEDLNKDFGLDSLSNRINRWEDFPDVRGTINASLSAAYKRFLRDQITEFLAWQADIIRDYIHDGQFITHNFDYEWRDYSYGLQPEVDQKAAAECLDIVGVDIYHPSQDDLTGREIAFGGAIGRAIKKDNYLLLETQSQGRISWLPYPGQIRLQAYSHLASGSDSVMYWNWHSIHSSYETYWKGILSHDLEPNETYNEIGEYTEEIAKIEKHLLHLKKSNECAILIDNASLTGIDEFSKDHDLKYNDILRRVFDACYDMNLECDFVYKDDNFSQYKMLIVPALYSADDATINKLRSYVEAGGHLIMTFKSCFSDSELKVYSDAQPHDMTDVLGITYNQFTIPHNTSILFDDGQVFETEDFIELVKPGKATIWARYVHPYWGKFAAVTHNKFVNGSATYIGCYSDEGSVSKVIRRVSSLAGINLPSYQFPIIRRSGTNMMDEPVNYLLNYSMDNQTIVCDRNYIDIITGTHYEMGEGITLSAWGVAILLNED